MKQSFDNIQPKYGGFYTLAESNPKAFDGYDVFRGIYLGFNPNKTPLFFRVDSPEGYIFVVKNAAGEFEFYCHREDRLKETWLSDGDDGPEWPVGINVSNVEIKLRDTEIEYLKQLFARKKDLRKAA